MNLEDKIQELEEKLTSLGEILSAKEKELAEILSINSNLKAENEQLLAKNKELDKELTLIKTATQVEKEKSEAENIINEIFASSSIKDKFLQDKIKSMLDYNTFRKEDGSFDSEEFKKAFTTEVSDWEAKLPVGTSGIGAGISESKKLDFLGEQSAFGEENARIVRDILGIKSKN